MVKLDCKELEDKIDSYLKMSEIVNPEFIELKRLINNAVEKKSAEIFDKYCAGNGASLSKFGLQDLVYGLPSNIHSIGAFGKKIDKISIGHPFVDASRDLYNEFKIIHEKFKELKGFVIKTSEKRIEKKNIEKEIKIKKFNDADSLTGVLLVHLENFVEVAGVRACDKYDSLMKKLSACGWDIDVVAPKPDAKNSKNQYRWTKDYRQMLLSLTDGDSNIRKISAVKKEKYKQLAMHMAKQDYMLWVYKMIDKIGAKVVSASMEGDPWIESRLEVVTEDRGSQVWFTKMIINYSKYHKPFNQFPSRREKENNVEVGNTKIVKGIKM